MSDIKYKKQPSIKTKKKWLDLYYGDTKASVKSIADDFGYPEYTVYRVLRKGDPDKKERSDKGTTKKTPIIDVDFDRLALEGESPETQLGMMIQESIRAISQKKRLTVGQLLLYTNQLTGSLRKLRSVQFGQMAKNLDVKIVERLIRRYEPDAGALRIIEVFKEVAAEVKADKNS
jgi:hypothetical protein